MCCIPVFCLVKWNDGVKETGSCDLCGLKDLQYRKLELEFPWKSSVVLDSCGSKDFEKRG